MTNPPPGTATAPRVEPLNSHKNTGYGQIRKENGCESKAKQGKNEPD
jgi:hypothetical protein